MAQQEQLLVESLVHQCYHYITMNLEKFPVSYLSMLPGIADVCLLEDTEYVEGFQDMAAYWKLPCEDFMKVALDYADVACYVEEWDSVEYAIIALGCVYDEFYCGIHLPFNDRLNPNDRGTVILLLYAI